MCHIDSFGYALCLSHGPLTSNPFYVTQRLRFARTNAGERQWTYDITKKKKDGSPEENVVSHVRPGPTKTPLSTCVTSLRRVVRGEILRRRDVKKPTLGSKCLVAHIGVVNFCFVSSFERLVVKFCLCKENLLKIYTPFLIVKKRYFSFSLYYRSTIHPSLLLYVRVPKCITVALRH